MGAWGPDTFENDEACDWTYELHDGGMQHVLAGLEACFKDPWDPLEASTAVEGLAASDVIARLAGRFGQQNAYTETADCWAGAQPDAPSPELLARAREAVDRILGPGSELARLWRETGDDSAWRICVSELRKRLEP